MRASTAIPVTGLLLGLACRPDAGETGAETSTSEATTTSPTTTSATGTDEGTTDAPPVSEDCRAGCAVEALCGGEWASAEACAAWCEANLVEAAMFTLACRDAWEAVSRCVGTLDCGGFSQFQMGMACQEESYTLYYECAGQVAPGGRIPGAEAVPLRGG